MSKEQRVVSGCQVFVYYPRGVRTGGPEALHQLVHELRSQKIDAHLVPIPGTARSRAVAEYARYDAPEIAHAADRSDSIIVLPETHLRIAWRFRYAHVYVWWLSIDFSALFYAERRLKTLPVTGPVSLAKWLLLYGARANYPVRRWRLRRRSNVRHLAQSVYAQQFLRKRLGIEAKMLSDVTRLTREPATPMELRGRTVAYNPSKGGRLVERVREVMQPDWDFVALRGMSGREIERTLSSSAVYLDLGHHPGKDRMPREAALGGAVVIVAKRGSASVAEDVPLADSFKVELGQGYERRVFECVEAVLAKPESSRRAQRSYVDRIKQEEVAFRREVREAFIDISPCDSGHNDRHPGNRW